MINIDSIQKNLIENGIVALATVSSLSIPNLVCIGAVKVVASDKILFTDNYFNKTRINLVNNSHISLAVWDSTGEKAYQYKGECLYLTSGKWKEQVDSMEENKGLAHKAAILMTVTEIWDLSNPKLIASI